MPKAQKHCKLHDFYAWTVPKNYEKFTKNRPKNAQQNRRMMLLQGFALLKALPLTRAKGSEARNLSHKSYCKCTGCQQKLHRNTRKTNKPDHSSPPFMLLIFLCPLFLLFCPCARLWLPCPCARLPFLNWAPHEEPPPAQVGGSPGLLAHPAPDASITPPWISQPVSENPILAGLHTSGASHST